jgi:hypothetical protein
LLKAVHTHDEHVSRIKEVFDKAPKLFDELHRRAFIRQYADEIAIKEMIGVFDELVIKPLTLPHVLSKDDFLDGLGRAQLFRANEDFEGQYKRFAQSLCDLAITPLQSAPFRVVAGYYAYSEEGPVEVWRGESGLSVSLLGALPLGPGHPEFEATELGLRVVAPKIVYAKVEGACSAKALRAFRNDSRAILRTALRAERITSDFAKPIVDDDVSTFPEKLVYADGCTFVPEMFKAYFAPQSKSKKDPLDRRLRNAAHLLVNADRQRHDSLSLSLSMSAIEALVCEGSEGISNQLSDNVATILEPDSRRRADAVRFVKRLYDARSKTLHGAKLEHEADARRNAWAIATAVFLAIVQRREFQGRTGFAPEAPNELFDELRGSKWVPGEIPGVLPSPVRTLWATGAV